jgi:hypothetical protein
MTGVREFLARISYGILVRTTRPGNPGSRATTPRSVAKTVSTADTPAVDEPHGSGAASAKSSSVALPVPPGDKKNPE